MRANLRGTCNDASSGFLDEVRFCYRIEAPLYDVGVLSERGMLPGLDGISAAAVLDRLSLLKYRNAHGSHIYIRPSGEHRFTTLDDLSETSLARLAEDGWHTRSASFGGCQPW
jgi:RepB DNA-primase N-terminal domain